MTAVLQANQRIASEAFSLETIEEIDEWIARDFPGLAFVRDYLWRKRDLDISHEPTVQSGAAVYSPLERKLQLNFSSVQDPAEAEIRFKEFMKNMLGLEVKGRLAYETMLALRDEYNQKASDEKKAHETRIKILRGAIDQFEIAANSLVAQRSAVYRKVAENNCGLWSESDPARKLVEYATSGYVVGPFDVSSEKTVYLEVGNQMMSLRIHCAPQFYLEGMIENAPALKLWYAFSNLGRDAGYSVDIVRIRLPYSDSDVYRRDGLDKAQIRISTAEYGTDLSVAATQSNQQLFERLVHILQVKFSTELNRKGYNS